MNRAVEEGGQERVASPPTTLEQNLFFPRKTLKHKIFTCETLFKQDISSKKR